MASDAPEPTLAALAAQASRRLSDGALVACAVCGLVVAAMVGVLAPSWARVIPGCLLLAAFGGWGIGERERSAPGRRAVLAATLRGTAMLIGLGSIGALVVQLFGSVLGTWIS